MFEAIAMCLGAVWFGYKWFVKSQFKYIVLYKNNEKTAKSLA